MGGSLRMYGPTAMDLIVVYKQLFQLEQLITESRDENDRAALVKQYNLLRLQARSIRSRLLGYEAR